MFAEQRRADRHAAPQSLADRNEVRLQADRRWRRTGRPVRPRPLWTSSAISSAPVRLARVHDRGGKSRRERPHAALALNRFGDDRRRLRRDGGEERRRIVHGHEAHTWHQRLERCAIVLVGGHRQRAEGASVKRFLERDDFGARLAARVPVAPRKLQTGFDRLRAAVAEERARETREMARRSASRPCNG